LRYSIETRLTPEAVIKEALAYFGTELGLKVSSKEENILSLEGGGGHVTLIICPGEKTTVEIETREWDRAVTQFMSRIRR